MEPRCLKHSGKKHQLNDASHICNVCGLNAFLVGTHVPVTRALPWAMDEMVEADFGKCCEIDG